MRPALILPLVLAACASTNSPARRIPDVSEAPGSAVSRVRSGSFEAVIGTMTLSYLADRETRLCFVLVESLSYGPSKNLAPVDCCVLQRVPRTRPAVPWLDDESCRSGAAPTPAPASEPTPPPPASATAPR